MTKKDRELFPKNTHSSVSCCCDKCLRRKTTEERLVLAHGFRGFNSWLLDLLQVSEVSARGCLVSLYLDLGWGRARSQAGLLTSRAARKQRRGGMAPNNPLKDTHQCPHSLPWTPPQCSTTSQQCTASQPGFECRHLSSPHATNCLNMSYCVAFVFSESTDLSSQFCQFYLV